jgi:hypothetical protein
MKKYFLPIIIILFIIYLLMPLIAGLTDLGVDSRGPKIYNERYHDLLYRLSYSLVSKERPRILAGQDRPWFY